MNIPEREKAWLLAEKYHGRSTDAYFQECKLIDEGMPVAYLIGYIPFGNCTIDLSLKPLIPRPETEYWVFELTKRYVVEDNLQVLDLCCGSGCIGIAIAKNIPDACVDFADINSTNIDQTKINIHKNFIKTSKQFFVSDLFNSVPVKQYSVIVSNPPYISNDRKDTVQESVLKHEDERALFAYDNGLEIIKRIIAEAPHYLSDKGKVYVEFDPWQIELIDDFMKAQEAFDWKFQNDQYEKPRVLVCTKR